MPCGQFRYMRSYKPCNDNMPCHYGPLGCWAVPMGRLKKLDLQAKPGPTRNNSYGPLFGLRKNRPFSKLGRGLGECGTFSPTKYNANSGDSSQVTYFKRVYGAKNIILYRLGQCCGGNPDYGCQCYPNCTYQPDLNCSSGSH